MNMKSKNDSHTFYVKHQISKVDLKIKLHEGEYLTKHYDVIFYKCFVNHSLPSLLIHP